MKKNFRVLLVYPNLPLMLVPPLAVALFTTIIREAGYSVSLFDTTDYIDQDDGSSPRNRVKYLQARDFDESKDLGVSVKTGLFEDYEKKIIEYAPEVIIYVAVVEDTFIKTLGMINKIAKFNIPSIMGGIFPSAAPEKCLAYDSIDYVGIGEGESTIMDFINCVFSGGDLKQIKGTAHLNEFGLVVKNEAQSLVNIEDVEPDFSLFAEERFYRPMGGQIFKSMPIETYRGCPYQCTYCNSPGYRDDGRAAINAKNVNETVKLSNKFLRRKSMETLSNEIEKTISKFKPEFLYFVDDSFMARPKAEMVAFCEMYSKYKLPFWFNTRPENCTEENLKLLKDVGCYRISFGIECGNEEFRTKALRRNGSNEKIKKWFDTISDSGIPYSVNLIIGFPGETRDMVMETVELARNIDRFDSITVSIFTPYNGTVLRDVAVKNGWLDDSVITVHTTSSSLLDMPDPYLSKHDIDCLMRVLPLYVYFDKEEWSNIYRIEKMDEGWEELYNYYSFKYKTGFLGEDLGDEILERPSIGATTTACASDPKNEVKINLENVSI